MSLHSTLVAIALVGLPFAAQAQNIHHADGAAPSAALGEAAGSSRAFARPAGLTAVVALTRPGIHRSVEGTIAPGLAIVDRQVVDVDGDGDRDELLMVDVAEGDDETIEGMGRGVAIAFRERRGWRAETVASVAMYPMEAGYNWGRIESLAANATPLLHVLYSQAGVNGERQADTVVRFDQSALRPVYANAVVSTPAAGGGPGPVTRTLDVQTADLDGDGVNELLERVGISTHCPESGCATPDGMIAPAVGRRAYRWEASRGQFVEFNAPATLRLDAARILDGAVARARALNPAAADDAVHRAYAADPLDPRARMAEARRLIRSSEYDTALVTLQFAWPQGFGRDAVLLRAEAAAYSNDPDCRSYLAVLRNDGTPGGADLATRLSQVSRNCQ